MQPKLSPEAWRAALSVALKAIDHLALKAQREPNPRKHGEYLMALKQLGLKVDEFKRIMDKLQER